MLTHRLRTSSLKPVWSVCSTKYWCDQRRAVKFHKPDNKMNCAQRRKIFCYWTGQKSSGVGCTLVEIPTSGVENGG